MTIAKSADGEWLPPALGFAKKCGVSTSDLKEVENKKGQLVISARQFQLGQDATTLLPDVFKSALMAMKLPIAMVWGNNNGPFIRPVKWVCSIIEDKTIDWEFLVFDRPISPMGIDF